MTCTACIRRFARQFVRSQGLLLLALGAAIAADPLRVALSAPGRLELYLDGVRFEHVVRLAAGRTHIPLPTSAGDLVQVDGADAWVIENRIDSVEPPAMPALLVELATTLSDLGREDQLIADQEEVVVRLTAELRQRIGQRAVRNGAETDAWQEALDGSARSGRPASARGACVVARPA